MMTDNGNFDELTLTTYDVIIEPPPSRKEIDSYQLTTTVDINVQDRIYRGDLINTPLGHIIVSEVVGDQNTFEESDERVIMLGWFTPKPRPITVRSTFGYAISTKKIDRTMQT